MTSIFIGQSGLRLKYHDVTWADLAGAHDEATAVLLTHLGSACRIALFDNSLDTCCAICAVHPDADSSIAANRLMLFELACPRQINFDMLSASGMEFDPGTKLFVYRDPLHVPTSGKVRLIHWG